MAWETIVVGVVMLLLAVLWYGLQGLALRDLRARPRVRGDNKILWAFAILCVPYLGALGYLSLGPTSFLPRHGTVRRAGSLTVDLGVAPVGRTPVGKVVPRTQARRRHSLNPVITPAPGHVRPIAPRPMMDAVPRTGLVIDPVIGTDSADLIPAPLSSVRRKRPAPAADTIRWPGPAVPHGWQHADADVHD